MPLYASDRPDWAGVIEHPREQAAMTAPPDCPPGHSVLASSNRFDSNRFTEANVPPTCVQSFTATGMPIAVTRQCTAVEGWRA